MKALELKMPDDVHQKLSDLAAQQHQPVDEYAACKLQEFIRAVDDFAELERRAQCGSYEKFRAAMSKVPATPPMPGDEL